MAVFGMTPLRTVPNCGMGAGSGRMHQGECPWRTSQFDGARCRRLTARPVGRTASWLRIPWRRMEQERQGVHALPNSSESTCDTGSRSRFFVNPRAPNAMHATCREAP